MGIFADFLAQAQGLDPNPPRAATQRVIWNDLQDLQARHGDADYPSGFTGRPALAILHVTGVLGPDVPASGTIEPLTSTYDRGNNAALPKEPTIRLLASEAAIEDNYPPLEDAILDLINYPLRPSQAGTPDAPAFTPQPGTDPGLPAHSFLFESGLPVTAGNTINATRGGTTMIASAGTVYATNGQQPGTNTAARFLSTQGKFVLANTQWTDGTGPWHGCFWWKRRQVFPGSFATLAFQGGVGGFYTWQVRLISSSSSIQLHCWESDDSPLGQPSPAFYTAPLNEWTWIDWFYDGSQIGIAADNGNHDTVSAPIGLHLDAGDDLELGTQAGDNDLDSFMIFNKKLTDDERDYIYNLGRGWEHA